MPSIGHRLGLAAGLCALTLGCTAGAQGNLPAEIPPQSYAGAQYVDSEGCVFIRAGQTGLTRWIPRLTGSREQLCGFSPTFPGGVPAERPLPADVPIIAGVLSPGTDGQVGFLATSPLPDLAADAARPSSPQVLPPEPDPNLARADLCPGRAAPQPGAASGPGDATDCGEASMSTGSALLLLDPSGTEPTSLQALCAETAATGRTFVHRDSGRPIECAPVAGPGPGTPASPVEVAGAHRPAAAGTRVAGLTGVRSGKRVPAAPLAVRPEPVAVRSVTIGGRVPASNPVVGEVTAPPPGYEPVWRDGRVNFLRGLRPELHASR